VDADREHRRIIRCPYEGCDWWLSCDMNQSQAEEAQDRAAYRGHYHRVHDRVPPPLVEIVEVSRGR
jgi:hypothetical protein